jgi:hypothetical protein
MGVSVPTTEVSVTHILDQPYRDANGLIVMCMYCHCTRRVLPDLDQWDWVEEYAVTTPASTSHGICAACLPFVQPA